jgi:hypothetical protein
MKNILKKFNFLKTILFFTCTVFLLINLSNINQPILEQHGFRQAQTALTAYYIERDGFKLKYETPVIGKSWSIPFEFPIYQALVAGVAKVSNHALDSTGRIINLLFTILVCFPLFGILKQLGVSKYAIAYSIAFYLSSPLYLFWGGTFMIEGAALFFSISFIYFYILNLNNKITLFNASIMFLALTLGVLQKITTILPIIAIIIPAALISGLYEKNRQKLVRFFYLSLIVGFGILIGLLWVRYSDSLKMENPIGERLTSSALRQWNYGSLNQRVSSELWVNVFYERLIKPSSFYFFGALASLAAFFYVKSKKILILMLLNIILFVAPIIIFANLHIVHNYYQTANLVFFNVLLGLVIYYFIGHKYSINFSNAIVVSLIISNYIFFYIQYYPSKSLEINSDNNRSLAISKNIKQKIPKDGILIVYGNDWSSELAYYSERRSLTLPWGQWDIEAIQNPEKFLGDEKAAAYIVCPNPNKEKIISALEIKYSKQDYSSQNIFDCDIYYILKK